MSQDNRAIARRAYEAYNAGDLERLREPHDPNGRGPDALMEFTSIYTFRQGKGITVQRFWDHDEALEAVGLRD